jgi:hypothetical protein
MTVDIQTVLSIFAGILLTLSETMPFITTIKANGILDMLKYFAITRPQTSETEPLLSHNEYTEHTEQTNDNIIINIGVKLDLLLDKLNNDNDDNTEPKLDNLINKIENLTNTMITFNKSNQLLNENIVNTRVLKLQQSELYELNFIINYIKSNYPKKSYPAKFLSKSNKQLLISEGYVVDYDIEKDIHNIKW